MKKKSLISIVVVCVFLLSGIAVIALAGVEPTPFQPEINQLGAVANILSSALDRVDKVMGVDPNPFEPGPVNRLEAIDNQLMLANDMVKSIAEEVMGIDPEPFSGDLGLALGNVRLVAGNIFETISINHPPDPCVPPDPCSPFEEALSSVQNSAQEIVDTVTFYLGECSEFCSVIVDMDECNVLELCEWVDVAGTPGYCCDSYDTGS